MNNQNNGVSISVKNLNMFFDNKQILKNINLELPRAKFISLVGKSGCGKTTFLRILAQLQKPTNGTIIREQINENEAKSITRLMFQEARLLPWKNIIENVGIGLKGDWKNKALEVLDEVGLLDKAKEWPMSLSGGQKQRVALARVLMHQPKILLLDEPFSALDALTRREMQSLLDSLWEKYKFTTILVTHDINEAVLLSDRIILLEEGEITLNLEVNIPKPRKDLNEIVRIENQILNSYFTSS